MKSQIEGHSAANLGSLQPKVDSCISQVSLGVEREFDGSGSLKMMALRATGSSPLWKWLCVFSCVCFRLAGFNGFYEAWAFCRGGPAVRTAEVCPQDQRAGLFRIRFQSTSFYYILMIRVIIYS